MKCKQRVRSQSVGALTSAAAHAKPDNITLAAVVPPSFEVDAMLNTAIEAALVNRKPISCANCRVGAATAKVERKAC